MKYEIIYKDYPIEIYTNDEKPINDIQEVHAIITTPKGRWATPIVVSCMLMENEEAFKQIVAENIYTSFMRNNNP